MFPYAAESFTPEESDVLERYFTNLDQPVFALVNLPEVVKGALFARYSRSHKSLRRLFLDEFAGDVEDDSTNRFIEQSGVGRAAALYDRVFLDYGDDSVAQLAGVHLACEQASNLLTKVLERARVASYMEQSTRYIPWDVRLPNGWYRYYRDPEVLNSDLGARYVGDMDRAFDTYADLVPKMRSHLASAYPCAEGESEVAWRRAIRAQAFDALRGLLPVGALANVGIYASGQAFEQLVLRLRAHPLPEARVYAEMVLAELRKVIPSFLTRVDRPERGGAWVRYREEVAAQTQSVARRLTGSMPAEPRADVTLVDHDPDGETKVVAAMLYAATRLPDDQLLALARRLSPDERDELVAAYIGERENRRQRPGRALERTEYRFDLVTDYGAFRDLQRHRMCHIEWQGVSTDLGWEVPQSVRDAGLDATFDEAMERARDLHDALADRFPAQAPYALGLAWRVRYVLQCNAREALHILELRSTPQGHPAYRRVVQEMHRLIAEEAGHPTIARAMGFVDHSDDGLVRREAEGRAELRRTGAAEAS